MQPNNYIIMSQQVINIIAINIYKLNKKKK